MCTLARAASKVSESTLPTNDTDVPVLPPGRWRGMRKWLAGRPPPPGWARAGAKTLALESQVPGEQVPLGAKAGSVPKGGCRAETAPRP